MAFNRTNIAGVVLAGGRSSRMGRDKAAALLGDRSLLARALERLRPQVTYLAVNAERTPDEPGTAHAPDRIAGKLGPMAGIHAAMVYAAGLDDITHVATVSVDSPFFPGDLVDWLAGALAREGQIAIAASEGRSHPVFGLWPVTLAEELEVWLRHDDNRRVRDFLQAHDVAEVRFPLQPTRASLLDPFFNVNTPDDLQEAERWLRVMA